MHAESFLKPGLRLLACMQGNSHFNPIYSGATARQSMPAAPSAPPYSPRYARMSEQQAQHHYR